MSIELWTAWVSEFQEYLAVFDTPTRQFIYAVAIGATVLSLIFSYYMTKMSLQFAIDIIKEVFGLLKNMGDTLVNGLKTITTPRYSKNLDKNLEAPAK